MCFAASTSGAVAARGRLALNAATSCCATKDPAVEAHVAAVYGVCHMGKITDRRGSLLYTRH